MNEVEQYLNDLGNGGNLESFENFDANVEHLVRTGYSMTDARRLAKTIGSSRGQSALGKNAGAGNGVAAQFDLTITRNSTTINAALPIVLFGVIDLESAYSQVINTLPAGVTLTSVVNTAGSYVFTYSDGTHTDTITITCAQTPYAGFLRATQTDTMSIRAYRIAVSSTDAVDQFNYAMQHVKRSLFGADKRDSLTPSTYISPDQYLATRVDIGDVKSGSSHVASIDKETSIQVLVKKQAFNFTLSVFVNRFDKLNASNLG